MCRSPCCSKEGINRGAWTKQEDMILSEYISIHGDGGWTNLPQKAGLNRCGKSCRLRWLHYLRSDIKRGNISPDEEELIIRMHRLLGNRWSLIAGRLPGRTDNEIKNYWNTHLKKKEEGQQYKTHNLNTHNLNKRPESRPPLQNGAFKTTPEKITNMAVRHYQTVTPDRCSNIGSSDQAFKLCQIQETTNSSKPWCDNDAISEDNSERIAFRMEDAYNLLETEADQESLQDSDHFAGNEATVDEILFDLGNLSSPNHKQSDFSTGFELQDFYSGPATLDADAKINEFERQSNTQQVNNVTLPDDQRFKEFYDSSEPVDWNQVLNYIVN